MRYKIGMQHHSCYHTHVCPFQLGTEVSLQCGAVLMITLPKMSRRTPSKLLSNCSFLYLRSTTKGFTAYWNMVSLTIHLSFVVTGHEKAAAFCTGPLSLPRTLNSTAYTPGGLLTSWVESSWNSPAGNRKLW